MSDRFPGRGFFTLILICLASFATLVKADTLSGEQIARKIADTYGYQDFEDIEAIKFTFNARVNGKRIKRHWKWGIKENKVYYKSSGDQDDWKYYQNRDISELPEATKQIDARFINDKYWLLFPFQLIRDEDAHITADNKDTEMPLGGRAATRVVIKYPEVGGYTPGDVYELFINENYIIEQWIYRKSGSPDPTRISTWEDNRNIGPLLISFDHKGPDKEFRVWFTDVSLKLRGRKDWTQ